MGILLLRDSIVKKDAFYPAGFIVNVPDDELIELIQNRIRIESGEDNEKRGRGRPRKVAMV